MIPESNLPKRSGSANQSDRTVMVTVQDLINCAMGPPDGNKVNFKLIQKILHILACQMRIQEQFVDFGNEDSQSSKTLSETNNQSTSYHGQNLQAKEKDKSDIGTQRDGRKTERKKAKHDREIENKEIEKAKEREIGEKKEAELTTIADKQKSEYEIQREDEGRDIKETGKAILPKIKEKEEVEQRDERKNEREKDKHGKDIENKEIEKAKEKEIEEKKEAELTIIADKQKSEYEIQREDEERDIEETGKGILPKIKEKEEAEQRDERKNEREKDKHGKDIENKEIEKAKEKEIEEKKEAELTTIADKQKSEYEIQREDEERDIKETGKAILPKIKEKEEAEQRDERKNETEKDKHGKDIENKEIEKAKEKEIEEKKEAELTTIADKQKSEYEIQREDEGRDIKETRKAILPKFREKEEAEQRDERKNEREKDKHGKDIENKEIEKAKEKEIEEKKEAKLTTIANKERSEYESQREDEEQDMEENENAILSKMKKKEGAEYSQKEKERHMEEKKQPTLAEIIDKEVKNKEEAKLVNITFDLDSEYENIKEMQQIAEKERKEKESQKEKEKHIKEKGKTVMERDVEDKNEAKLVNMTEYAEHDIQKAKERVMEGKKMDKLAKMNDQERAEYEDQNDKKQDIKEKLVRKLAKSTDKEGGEYKRQKAKERDLDEKAKLSKMTDKEIAAYEVQKAKERDLEEKAKLSKTTDKDLAEHKRQKAIERDVEEKAKLSKITDKEIAAYEVQKAKEQVMEEKSMANLAKMSDKVRGEYESYKAKELAMKEKKKKLKEKISDQKKKREISVKDSQPRVGSVEIVPRSEFDLLEERVADLEERVDPIPFPLLPFNTDLKKEISAGSSSLTNSMQALQMMARIEAAEEGVGRMADILTMLITESGMSKEVEDKLKITAVKDAALEEFIGIKSDLDGQEANELVFFKNILKGPTRSSVQQDSEMQMPLAQTSTNLEPESDDATLREKISVKEKGNFVKFSDLDYAIEVLKNELIKKATITTLMAQKTADSANCTVLSLADRIAMLFNIDCRINKLGLLIDDYSQQLASFDTAGINAQMASFYGQLKQTHDELEGGVTLFEHTFNKETEDVKDLKAKYDELVKDLELTEWSHKQLEHYQADLTNELKSLMEFAERLQDEKVDLEMITDALKDKVDKSQLEGLLNVKEYNISRAAMERTLLAVQEKFRMQDVAWMHTIKELSDIARQKADIKLLLNYKTEVENILVDLQQGLNLLAKTVGGPKAALLIRQLKMSGLCGACSIEAMQPDGETDCNMPPRLPAVLRRNMPTMEPVCETKGPPPPPPAFDERQHVCRRWVGGSHTLLSSKVVRTEAQAPELPPPTKKYTGYGDDGRAYQMEELLPPCSECTQPRDVTGIIVDEAGDTGFSVASGNVKKIYKNI